jgi:hypothetical protein
MKRISTALAVAGLLVLNACGGSGGGAEANNSAAAAGSDDLALPPENGTDPLSGGGSDTLENQANALDAGNLTGTTDLNSAGNSSDNTTNTQ